MYFRHHGWFNGLFRFVFCYCDCKSCDCVERGKQHQSDLQARFIHAFLALSCCVTHIIRAYRRSPKNRMFLLTGAVQFALIFCEWYISSRCDTLGTLADSFHVLFHATALVITALTTAIQALPPPDEHNSKGHDDSQPSPSHASNSDRISVPLYPYAFKRIPSVLHFTNATLTLFLCTFVGSELSHHASAHTTAEHTGHADHGHPHSATASGCGGAFLLTAAVVQCGLAAALARASGVGGAHIVRALADAFALGRAGDSLPLYAQRSARAAPAGSTNGTADDLAAPRAVFTCACVHAAVYAASFVLPFSAQRNDHFTALCVAIWTAASAWPYASAAATVLLHAAPEELLGPFARCVRECAAVEGVLEVKEERLWSVAPGHPVASLTVRLRSDAEELDVTARVRQILSTCASECYVQVEKDPPLDWLLPQQEEHSHHAAHEHSPAV